MAFHRLGLAVVDEQHRFGVMQRAALKQKGFAPDILVMTATPIPRTLTLTVYGDLDVSIIDQMPPGRKPIKTHWKRGHERQIVYETLRRLLAEGRQAYVICSLIEENEKAASAGGDGTRKPLTGARLLGVQDRPAARPDEADGERRNDDPVPGQRPATAGLHHGH